LKRRRATSNGSFSLTRMVVMYFLQIALGVRGWGQQQVPDCCISSVTEVDACESTRGFASKAENCSREIKDLPRFAQAGTEACAMAWAQAAALAQAHWKL
jgi:hypothetical protein